MTLASPGFDVPPYRLSGVVYGALMNHAPQLAALGDAVNMPPYKAPPQFPVLAVKPRHMLAADGDAVVVPTGAVGVEVGASLGIVIGRVACRVPVAQALDFVAGYLAVNEVQLSAVGNDSSHYRPAVRLKARDGHCVLGSQVVARQQVPDPDALAVQVSVDGVLVQQSSTGGRVRGVAQLLADVTEFMTLQPGDVLLLGAAHAAPRVGAGQSVVIHIEGIGSLHNCIVAEEGGA